MRNGEKKWEKWETQEEREEERKYECICETEKSGKFVSMYVRKNSENFVFVGLL